MENVVYFCRKFGFLVLEHPEGKESFYNFTCVSAQPAKVEMSAGIVRS